MSDKQLDLLEHYIVDTEKALKKLRNQIDSIRMFNYFVNKDKGRNL